MQDFFSTSAGITPFFFATVGNFARLFGIHKVWCVGWSLFSRGIGFFSHSHVSLEITIPPALDLFGIPCYIIT